MRIRSAARAALAMAVLASAIVLTAGCAAVPGPSARPAAWMSFTEIPGTGLTLTEAGGGLYASWNVAPPGAGMPQTVLARLDARTGAVAARNAFSPGRLGTPLFADGALWVTDSGSLGGFLLRLDPATLMVTGELRFGAGQYRASARLAYAGGSLWLAGGDELLRVSPASVEPTAVIALRGSARSDVAASPDGSVLVVLVLAVPAAGGQGRPSASVQRRDPETGALLAARPAGGAVAIDGFASPGAGSGVWVTRTAGTSAYAERYSAATLAPAATVPVAGDAGVRVADGLLWVTDDEAGGPARDYCADASSGRRLAALPITDPRRGELLAAGRRVLYYAEPGRQRTGWRIAAVPAPAACG
jgi:hypothetical protein